MKESQASDKTGKGMIPPVFPSTGAGSALHALYQTSPAAVFAPFCGSSGRRWLAAWAGAFVAHSVCFFLLWGLRLQVIESPPSARAIALRLLPSHSPQASVSEDVVSSPMAEELHTLTKTLHGNEKGQEKKKRASAAPKPLEIIKSAIPRAVATAKPKSTTLSLSTPAISSLGETLAGDTAEPSSLLKSAEKPPETNVPSFTNREETSLANALHHEDGAPLPAAQASTPPVLISQIAPSYPERARTLGIQGLVRLEAILNREGRVEQDIKVLESIPFLDEAASTALRQWRFKPARDRSGQPVRVIVEVPFRFALKQ